MAPESYPAGIGTIGVIKIVTPNAIAVLSAAGILFLESRGLNRIIPAILAKTSIYKSMLLRIKLSSPKPFTSDSGNHIKDLIKKFRKCSHHP